MLGKQVTLEKFLQEPPRHRGPRKHSKIQICWHVMFFFFRAVKKGFDVESGELSHMPAEYSSLSRMRFLAVGLMIQLAAFTIIKSEFYVARILCRNLRAFQAFFPV